MSISISKYVQVTSGVGGTGGVANRELITRLFTSNALVPTSTTLEFINADDVGTYFGTASEEYVRAVFYFGWISKLITQAQKISFARWNNDTAVAATIYGKVGTYLLTSYTGISNGSLNITLDSITHTVTAIDTTTASSLSDVASDIQAKIRAADANAFWATATVSYDSVRKSFNFVSGSTGTANISVAAAGSGTDLRNLIGWGTGAIFSNGQAAQLIADCLIASAADSDNFGSFVVMPLLANGDVVSAAAWNDAQNEKYIFSQRSSASNMATLQALVVAYSGCALTLDLAIYNEYPDMVPGVILAATDYSRAGANSNYMYTQFPLTASVTNDADAATYDALRANYYGQTQKAGQQLSFYQDGVLMGTSSDALDMNVYANEIWLKDAIITDVMNLLIALPALPANNAGTATLLSVLQGDINTALLNGTIEPGKTLTTVQKAYITTATGNANAWRQVQDVGYWVTAQISTYVQSSVTKFKANYVLVYSKGDAVRKVTGSDILI
jgi:hypothetical protein